MILRQLVRFIVVGVFNTALGYGIIFGCMYGLDMDPALSNAIGYLVGLLVSFSLHKAFTFESKAGSGKELARFLAAFLVAYFANLGMLLACIHAGMHEGLSQIVAGAVYVATMFVLNKFFVFKPVVT